VEWHGQIVFDLEPGGLAGAAACRPFVLPAGHRCGVPGWQVFQINLRMSESASTNGSLTKSTATLLPGG